jgi:hypothetical protein
MNKSGKKEEHILKLQNVGEGPTEGREVEKIGDVSKVLI